MKSDGTRVVVQGFGNVGSVAAQQLHRFGAKVIAVSDYTGGLYNPQGLDVNKLIDYAAANGHVGEYRDDCERITNEELLQLEVAYHQVLQMAKKRKLYIRDAALALGISKIAQAKQIRGLFP